MAEQYLSDFANPTINGNVARRVLANEVLRGVTQGVLESNGEGVTQRFSNDTTGAQIRITQFMPFNQEARELGASLNGENFDGRTALQASTNGLGIDVITVINQNIDIPQVTMDMMPIDFLGNVKKNLTMDINNNINAMTIGGKFVATANAVAEGKAEFQYITLASATGNDWRLAFMNMDAQLDAGDEENGLAYFPGDDRCFVVKANIIPYLFNNGVLSIGGANHAYEMLAQGGISPGAKQDIRDGYAGELLGKSVYKFVPLIAKLSAKYAGVPVWAFDEVYAYESSGFANVRAIAQNDEIKMIDSPDGQGVRVQPNFRMGFKSLYAKGNVFLVETGYTNPAGTGDDALKLKAPGSRPAYSKDTKLSSVSLGTTAVTYVTADNAYKLSVASNVTQQTLSYVLADKTTYYTGVSNDSTVDLSTGANTFYVGVIAEDGTKAQNKVVITRASN